MDPRSAAWLAPSAQAVHKGGEVEGSVRASSSEQGGGQIRATGLCVGDAAWAHRREGSRTCPPPVTARTGPPVNMRRQQQSAVSHGHKMGTRRPRASSRESQRLRPSQQPWPSKRTPSMRGGSCALEALEAARWVLRLCLHLRLQSPATSGARAMVSERPWRREEAVRAYRPLPALRSARSEPGQAEPGRAVPQGPPMLLPLLR